MKNFALLAVVSFCLLSSSKAFAAVRYVNLSNASPSAPFTSWDTAATNIQDAIASAEDADLILVSNGVYNIGGAVVYGSETNRVALTNAITLSSVNGPEVTTIRGGTQTRCAYVGSNAVLNGFTLLNGVAGTSGDSIKEMSGGGAWCEANGVITNCIIKNNSAPNGSTGGGGGVYGGQVYNSVLSGNYGLLGGGARASMLLNCVLRENSSADGGASFQCILSQCQVSNNSSTPSGGGTAFGTNYNCLITGNVCTGVISGNQAYGGGTYRSINYNCVIAGNSALRGGGAYSGALYNCTVAGNSANDGGGVHGADIAGYYTNCIIYFNTSAASGGVNNWSGGFYDHCCAYPLPGGAGNFTNNPGLLDWPKGFYQLKCGSSCIDAGVDLSITNDIRGLPRPLDGNDDSIAQFDVGAYEFSPASDYTPVIQAGHTNFATQFAVLFNGGVGDCASLFWWDFGDGILVTNQSSVSHSWNSAGPYDVRLSAFYASLGQTLVATTQVQVAQQQIHYVRTNNPAPVYPYVSWATAATNIQDAIGATLTGDLILVTNGVYDLGGTIVYGQQTNRVVLTGAFTLSSVNGPQVTTISGGTQTRCIYVGREAVLSGFTLSNGRARTSGDAIKEMSGGGLWCEPGAMVTNCIISSNSATAVNGGGGGAYGGTFYNCTFINSTGSLGGAIRSGTLWNCTLKDNRSAGLGAASGGGGAYASALFNCTLSNNVANAYNNGGGAYQCLLSNCVVKFNNASINGGGAAGVGGGTYQGTNYYCLIMNNAAGTNSGTGSGTGSGGGTYQSTNYSCLLLANTAGGSGGGDYQGFLVNCTISSNSASSSGGGIYGSTVFNSIIYFNSSPSGSNWAGSAFINYSCTAPVPGGSGNMGSNPQLTNAPSGLCQLKFGSPCIDVGLTNNLISGTGNDLVGTPRSLDGDGNGIARIDMGAYEFNLVDYVSTNWLASYGLNADDPLTFASDPDNDGFTSLQEWIAGTNPTNALSALTMEKVIPQASGASVSWNSVGGKIYFLQRGTNLGTAPLFSTIQSNLVGQAGTTTFIDTAATDAGPYFYRIGVQ